MFAWLRSMVGKLPAGARFPLAIAVAAITGVLAIRAGMLGFRSPASDAELAVAGVAMAALVVL